MSVKACVIGWPIEHSRSPLIHGYWLDLYGIAGSYTREAVPPDELEAFISDMPLRGFAGCNVTVPHKERALALAQQADEAARAIGAANTLWYVGGELNASNTDSYGFLTNLDERAPGWDANKGVALVIGAGGAARAVLHALLTRGFGEIRIANRTRSRAQAIADHFSGHLRVADWEDRNALIEGCDLVVNATSLGMDTGAPLELDLAGAGETTVVTDLVYAPLKTALLEQAGRRGLKAVDGLGMLLHQAVPGFEKWFGVRPEVTDDLRALVTGNLTGA